MTTSEIYLLYAAIIILDVGSGPEIYYATILLLVMYAAWRLRGPRFT